MTALAAVESLVVVAGKAAVDVTVVSGAKPDSEGTEHSDDAGAEKTAYAWEEVEESHYDAFHRARCDWHGKL